MSMTLAQRLAILDVKFAEFSSLTAKLQNLHAEVFTELGAIADEYGEEGGMLAMERMLKFQAALVSYQKGLQRTEPPAKKPYPNVQ